MSEARRRTAAREAAADPDRTPRQPWRWDRSRAWWVPAGDWAGDHGLVVMKRGRDPKWYARTKRVGCVAATDTADQAKVALEMWVTMVSDGAEQRRELSRLGTNGDPSSRSEAVVDHHGNVIDRDRAIRWLEGKILGWKDEAENDTSKRYRDQGAWNLAHARATLAFLKDEPSDTPPKVIDSSLGELLTWAADELDGYTNDHASVLEHRLIEARAKIDQLRTWAKKCGY